MRRREWWLGLALALGLSAAYLYYYIDRGWIPHDEGTLAQSAERVLAGEMPHRDFIELYTGGLTYLHAFAFKLFGVHLLALRYILFAATVAWIAAFYHVAARFVAPRVAALVTIIAVVWSVPNYPAGMPSWYILFLATGGVAALLAYVDKGHRGWLLIAGLLGGLSVLMKTPGLLFVAAGLLFLLYHESQRAGAARDQQRGIGPALVPGAILAMAVLALLAIGLSRRLWIDLYQFTLPGLIMVAIVAWTVFRHGLPSRAAGRAMIASAFPFLLGAALPVGALLAYYAAAGALPELIRDLVLLSARTAEGASLRPPLPFGLIPLAVVIFIALRLEGRAARLTVVQYALAIVALPAMLVPKSAYKLESMVWSSFAETTPAIIVLLAILILRGEAGRADATRQSHLVLVGCVAAFCSLVQYPFAAPIYFSYSLPLLLLAVVLLLREWKGIRPRAVQGLAAVYLFFGALYVTPLQLAGLLPPTVGEETAVLDLPRGGLVVGRADAEGYPVAVQLLRDHSPSGVTYAGPDAPEMYFLAELKNPSPVLFDYLSPDTLFHQRLLQRFDTLGVNAVAVRWLVLHSPPLTTDILRELTDRFPYAQEMGPYVIRWR